MKYPKIILPALVSLGVFFAFNAFAAARLTVPKNSPLQPIQQDTAPNISNNINSPDGDINQNLKSQVPAEENQPQTNPADTTDQSAVQPAPIVGEVPTSSTTFYWVLFFIGLAGLMGLGLWSYFRFLRKQ